MLKNTYIQADNGFFLTPEEIAFEEQTQYTTSIASGTEFKKLQKSMMHIATNTIQARNIISFDLGVQDKKSLLMKSYEQQRDYTGVLRSLVNMYIQGDIILR